MAVLNMNGNSATLLYQKIMSLSEMTDSSINKVFETARLRILSKGEIILKEGQVCRVIVFVEKGCLRTFTNKDGVDINTEFTFETDFTTNLKSLRTGVPSDTTIQAGEPSTVYEFNRDEMLQLYNLSPEIESFGRKLLEQLLIKQEEHLNLFKLYTPTERYQYIRNHQPQLLQRITLLQLASYLGITRETLSRIRKKKR